MRGDDDREDQDKALAAFGLKLERPQQQHYEVWPENWEAFELFMVCETQWRVDGFTGRASGIDYSGLQAAMEMMGIGDRRQAFSDIRLMERAALTEMHKDGK